MFLNCLAVENLSRISDILVGQLERRRIFTILIMPWRLSVNGPGT